MGDHVMSTDDVFRKFYSKLVETLPLNDATFVAMLYSRHLLSRELKNQLNLSDKTSAVKATIFLDSVIEPSVISGVGSSFDELLTVMKDSEYQCMKELAEQIKTSLRKSSESNSDNG